MNREFFNFLDELEQLTQQKIYTWKTSSFDRVTLNAGNFELIIDKLFAQDIGEYGEYIYYVTYSDENNKFNIPVFPSLLDEYSSVSRLFNTASTSSWTKPQLRKSSEIK